jgi:hypothetical protein
MIIDITCPNCNFTRKVPEEKIPQGVRWATCPRCKKTFEFDSSGKELTGPTYENINRQIVDTGDRPSPWERRMDLGLLKGIWLTFRHALFSPTLFYSKMRRIKGIREPLAFGMLLGSIGTMLRFFWEFLYISRGSSPLSRLIPPEISVNTIFFILIILSPLIVVISMFITGCLIHLFLMIFRGDKRGFDGTFRVIAFSQSTNAFSLIPVIGILIGFVWNLIVMTIGLKNIHDTSYFKVIMAVISLLILKGIMLIPYLIIKAGMSGLLSMAV